MRKPVYITSAILLIAVAILLFALILISDAPPVADNPPADFNRPDEKIPAPADEQPETAAPDPVEPVAKPDEGVPTAEKKREVWGADELAIMDYEHPLITQLKSPDRAARLEARDRIIEWRRCVTGHLINIIKRERESYQEDDEKLITAFVLSRLRATEAVPILLDNLLLYEKLPYSDSFKSMRDRDTKEYTKRPPDGVFAYVLKEIGKPAVAAVLKEIDDEKDKKRIKSMSGIIRHVEQVPFSEDIALSVDCESYPKFTYEDLAGRYAGEKPPKAVRAMTSESPYQRKHGSAVLLSRYLKLVEGCWRIVRNHGDRYEPDDSKTLALEILGEFRVSYQSTLEVIIEVIKYVDPKDKGKEESGIHPAVEALVRIGKPAVYRILLAMRLDVDDETFALYLEVIRRVEGEQAAIELMKQLVKTRALTNYPSFPRYIRQIGRILTGTGEYGVDENEDGIPDTLGVFLARFGLSGSDVGMSGYAVAVCNEIGRRVALEMTDSEGMLRITLPPGRYKVRSTDRPGSAYHDWDCHFDIDPGTVTELDIVLDPIAEEGSFIVGVVRDNLSGAPLPDVEVSVLYEEWRTALAEYTGRTDSKGRFRIEVDAGRNYTVETTKKGFLPGNANWAAARENESTKIELRMTPCAEIYGRVTDPTTGKPVHGISIPQNFWRAPPPGRHAYTDENGEYSVLAPVGKLKILIKKRYAFADAIRGSERVKVIDVPREGGRFDFEIVASQGRILGDVFDEKGNLYDMEEPFMAKLIRLLPYKVPGDEGLPAGRVTMEGHNGYSARKGIYSIHAPPGDYRVLLTAPGYYPAVSDIVTAVPGEDTRFDVGLERLGGEGTISGKVTDAETVRFGDRDYIHHYPVAVFYEGPRERWFVIGREWSMLNDDKYRTRIEPDGTFTRKLTAGKWLMKIPVKDRSFDSSYERYYRLINIPAGVYVPLEVSLKPVIKKESYVSVRLVAEEGMSSAARYSSLSIYVYSGGALIEELSRVKLDSPEPLVFRLQEGEIEIVALSKDNLFGSERVKVTEAETYEDIFSARGNLGVEITTVTLEIKPLRGD